MKRIIGFKATSNRCGFLSLVILLGLLIACQDSHSSNSSQTKQSEQPASAQATAPTPNDRLATSVAANVPAQGTEQTHTTNPSIEITEVPSKGAGPESIETIAGTVSGVKISECKVVVFARTNTWYVQPYIDSADTSINADNTWRTDTHLGSQYAALLVKKSYKPPTTTATLPEVGAGVLAIATANAKE